MSMDCVPAGSSTRRREPRIGSGGAGDHVRSLPSASVTVAISRYRVSRSSRLACSGAERTISRATQSSPRVLKSTSACQSRKSTWGCDVSAWEWGSRRAIVVPVTILTVLAAAASAWLDQQSARARLAEAELDPALKRAQDAEARAV